MNLKFIDSKEILKLILLYEESTYPELYSNIQTAFPNTKKRQHEAQKINVTSIKFIPFKTKNTLQVKATATSKGNQYSLIIQFSDIAHNVENKKQVVFTAVDGSRYRINPIRLSQTNVKVRCNCLDFYYRFAAWNYEDKSLVGRSPPLYQKKTDRPPVNPAQVPGLCKHLIKLFTTLKRQGIVT